jgi:hypothetical protein
MIRALLRDRPIADKLRLIILASLTWSMVIAFALAATTGGALLLILNANSWRMMPKKGTTR